MNKFIAGLAIAAVAAGAAGSLALAQSASSETFTLRVMPGEMGLLGPDGQHHDSIEPSSLVLHAGVPVMLRIINYDDSAHSITSTAMGMMTIIKPGVKEVAGAAVDTAGEIDLPRPEKGVKPTLTTRHLHPPDARPVPMELLDPLRRRQDRGVVDVEWRRRRRATRLHGRLFHRDLTARSSSNPAQRSRVAPSPVSLAEDDGRPRHAGQQSHPGRRVRHVMMGIGRMIDAVAP